MKLKHTILGAFGLKKKIILGAAAFALIGGTAPAFVNNSHALQENTDNVIYTTVGPHYFTLAGLDYYVNEGATMYIEDTSVADFYTGGGEKLIGDGPSFNAEATNLPVATDLLRVAKDPDEDEYRPIDNYICGNEEYACLQGKKIGETEIIVEQNGRVVNRIPLISVNFSPEYYVIELGNSVINGEGSIEGADNDLLVLRNILADDGARGTITGQRSFTIDTTGQNYSYYQIMLVWTIGNQRVGGGTCYETGNLVAEDLIADSKDVEAGLIDSLLDIYRATEVNGLYGAIVEGDKGAIIEWNDGWSWSASYFKATLDLEETNLSSSKQTKFINSLPKEASTPEFGRLRAKVYFCYEDSGHERAMEEPVHEGCVEEGELIRLSEKTNITINVPDAPALKSGYTRTYYVAIENDGKIENVEGKYDEKTKTFTFSTNLIGNFAYSYTDEFVPVVPDTGSIEKITKTAAITFLPLMTLAMIAFGIRNKKKATNKLAKKHNHFE